MDLRSWIFHTEENVLKYSAERLFKVLWVFLVECWISLWLLSSFRCISPVHHIVFHQSYLIAMLDSNKTVTNSASWEIYEYFLLLLIYFYFLFIVHTIFHSLFPGGFPQQCFPRKSGRTATDLNHNRCSVLK